MRSRVISANDEDHRPRASDSRFETKVLSRGPVHPACQVSPSWMIRSPNLGMSGNRTRRQLTNAPDRVNTSIRAFEREACSDAIRTKVIPCRGVVRCLVVLQTPLHLRGVNLTQTIDARIFCGNHARTGKVGDSYSDEQTNDRYPEDHDSCLLCHTCESTPNGHGPFPPRRGVGPAPGGPYRFAGRAVTARPTPGPGQHQLPIS